MLVDFALELKALKDEALSLPERRARHQELLERWRRQGVLVSESRPGPSEGLREAIAKLPQQLRPMWTAAIQHFRKRGAGEGWVPPETLKELGDLSALGREARLAVLTSAHATALGVPEDEGALEEPEVGVEVVRWGCFNQSRTWREAGLLAETAIPKGRPVAEVWQQRFRSLAAQACRVVALDRYALNNFARCTRARSGLRGLLENLSGSGRQQEVTLLCGRESDQRNVEYSREEVLELVSRAVRGLEGCGIERLTVYAAPSRVFKSEVHDRHLRFDDLVCELGTGLEVLQGRRVGRRCSFALKPRAQEHRDAERAVRESGWLLQASPDGVAALSPGADSRRSPGEPGGQ